MANKRSDRNKALGSMRNYCLCHGYGVEASKRSGKNKASREYEEITVNLHDLNCNFFNRILHTEIVK